MPEGYHQCFADDNEIDSSPQLQEDEIGINLEDGMVNQQIDSPRKEILEKPCMEYDIENSPKALACIQPIEEASNSNSQCIEGFAISKEVVMTLSKNNLCIRPIVGANNKKGNTAQKRRNREMTNLLRSWEKEAEPQIDIDDDVVIETPYENKLERAVTVSS